jgi:integration host factor subunit beta
MTKSDLITQLLNLNPHLGHEHAARIVDVIFEEIAKALVAGDRVEIRGFGTFSIKKYGAHKARNPRTGAPVSVGETSRPVFKPGKSMYELLNEPDSASRSKSPA